MQNLVKKYWAPALVLFAACVLVGCSAEAKRARHLKRAENYFQKGEYIKADIEYRNAARLGKTLDPELVGRLATIYYEQGRIIEAFSLLTNAVALKPDDLDLRYKLGTVWVTFRQFKEARETANFILSKRPDHREGLLLLADAAFKPEEIAAARQKVNEIRAKSGDTWAVHVALAELAMHERQTNVAEKEAELAAKLDAKAPQVNVVLSQLAALRKDRPQAEQFLRVAAENSPPRSPYRVLLARFKMEGTNVAEAKGLLDKQLKEAPDYVPAWALRGQIALGEKDLAECSRITKTVLSWDPLSYDIRLLNARTLVLQKQTKQALEEFQRLETLAPRAPEPRYEMAIAHLQNGTADGVNEALKKLDEAIRLNPDYAEAVVLRAELKLRTGAADQAVASLAPFTKSHPEAGGAYLLLASAYAAQNKLDEALKIYRAFLQRSPTVPEFWYLEGVTLLRQKKYDEALRSFEQTLILAPTYLMAAEQIIDVHLLRKEFDVAQVRVNDLLKLTTNSPAALMLQAKVSFAKRDLVTAESALMRVIQAQPDAMAPYSLLAEVYLSQRDPQKALAQLRSSVERNPKNVGAFVLMGVIQEAQKEYDHAKKSYEDALKLNPNLPPALNNLAYLLCEHMNQPEQALPHATKAHELSPNDQGMGDTLGWIFYRKGEYARALPLLRAAAEYFREKPPEPEVLYHYAMALYSTGDEPAARAAFARMTQLDKAMAEAKGIQRRQAVLDLEPSAPKAAELLEAAVKEDGNDFFATIKLGQTYARSGANDKARSTWEKAAKINLSSPQPLMLLASLHADKLNDLPRALELGRAARKLSPSDPAAAGVLGRISYRANDYAAALALLQEYARSDKADAEALYDLALAFYSAGQFDEVRGNLGNYITTPGAARVAQAKDLITLLDFYAGKGDARQAEAIASSRLQKDANDLPGLTTLGLVAQQGGKYSDAAQKFERIASLDKLFPLASRQLALLYGDHLQNDEKAYENGTKARQGFPNDLSLAKCLGKVAYRRGDFRSAVQMLGEAVRGANADAETLYFLGVAQYKARQPAEAKANINRALAMNLDPRLQTEATKLLKEIP